MAAPTLRSVGAVSSSGAAITPAYGTGTVAGDLVLMAVETADTGVAVTVTDWTELFNRDLGVGLTPNTRLTVLWRLVSDPGTDNRTTNDSGNHQLGVIVSVTTGTFDSGDPFDVTATAQLDTASTAVSVVGAVTTVADTLCLAIATGNLPDADSTTEFGAPTNGDLTSLTEQVDVSTSQGNGGALWIVSGVRAAAGTVGATTCTAVTSAGRAYGFIAIQPPSGGTPHTRTVESVIVSTLVDA